MASKLKTLSVILFTILIMGCSGTKSDESRTVDGLYVEKAYIDCGLMKKSEKEEIKFVFHLKNIGKHSIRIHKVDVSCPCVHIEEIPKEIKAKEIKEIKGKVNIKNQYGKISKPIFVNFNTDQVMLLRIIGRVE